MEDTVAVKTVMAIGIGRGREVAKGRQKGNIKEADTSKWK